MRASAIIGGLGLVVCMITVASATEVSNKIAVKASADKAWSVIGDFCGIQAWHPAIASCEMSKKGDTTFRTLTTRDGARIFEQQLSWDDRAHSYSYSIIESPLPVANYKATMKVDGAGGGNAEIIWIAIFEPKGASEEDAKKVIGGICAAGLDSLKAKLEGK